MNLIVGTHIQYEDVGGAHMGVITESCGGGCYTVLNAFGKSLHIGDNQVKAIYTFNREYQIPCNAERFILGIED